MFDTSILTEIGTKRLSGLDELDRLFSQLKSTETYEDATKVGFKIGKQIEKITKVPADVEINQLGSMAHNCGIMPKIKKGAISKPIKDDNNIDLSPFVDRVYIGIGRNFLDGVEPREMTAVMLHEIGHIIYYIQDNFSDNRIALYKAREVLAALNTVPFLNLVALPLLIATSRTFAFNEHMREYNADSVAVDYGYGDELVHLMKRTISSHHEHKPNRKVWVRIAMLRDTILGSSHPSYDDRVKKLLELIREKYADNYKSKKLKKVLDEYYPPEE